MRNSNPIQAKQPRQLRLEPAEGTRWPSGLSAQSPPNYLGCPGEMASPGKCSRYSSTCQFFSTPYRRRLSSSHKKEKMCFGTKDTYNLVLLSLLKKKWFRLFCPFKLSTAAGLYETFLIWSVQRTGLWTQTEHKPKKCRQDWIAHLRWPVAVNFGS